MIYQINFRSHTLVALKKFHVYPSITEKPTRLQSFLVDAYLSLAYMNSNVIVNHISSEQNKLRTERPSKIYRKLMPW